MINGWISRERSAGGGAESDSGSERSMIGISTSEVVLSKGDRTPSGDESMDGKDMHESL